MGNKRKSKMYEKWYGEPYEVEQARKRARKENP